jgi:hypothetical protein
LRITGQQTPGSVDGTNGEPDVVTTGQIQPRGGNETRPINYNVLYIIKI